MWLVTKFGTFSVVRSLEHNFVTLRSQQRQDLEQLRELFLPRMTGIVEDPNGNSCLAQVTKNDFALALKHLAEQLDYSDLEQSFYQNYGTTAIHELKQWAEQFPKRHTMQAAPEPAPTLDLFSSPNDFEDREDFDENDDELYESGDEFESDNEPSDEHEDFTRLAELSLSDRPDPQPSTGTRDEESDFSESHFDYQLALQTAIEAARDAGTLIKAEFFREGGPRGQDDKSPVDTEAETLIGQRLRSVFPDWQVIGEELGTQGDANEHTWLVDPHDGTVAFLRGYRGSSVSIALLRSNKVVLGVVYCPVPLSGKADLFSWAEGCGPARRNGRVMERTWSHELTSSSVALVSFAADNNPEANAILVSPARFQTVPSLAYRLALVAAGEAEFTSSLNGPNDYDYAAGHALLRAVGGVLVDNRGVPIGYHRHQQGSGPETQTALMTSVFGGSPHFAKLLCLNDWSKVFGKSKIRTDMLVRPEPSKIVSDHAILDRAYGCLLGQLVGDALGSLVEFRSESTIQRLYPEGVRDLADGGTHNTIAGQPTDDSELALALARSLAKTGDFDEKHVLQAYAVWLGSHPFDVGATTRQALAAAAWASDPQAAVKETREAASTTSQANGALMRACPLGILGWNSSPEQLADWARRDASLTHPHTVCQAANEVFVIAIALAIKGGKNQQELLQSALKHAYSSDDPGYQVVAARLEAAVKGPPVEPMDDSKQGWVLLALHNAFYQLLNAQGLEDGLVETIQRGGDTDTNAAIAGALLGAYHGAERIRNDYKRAILTCRPIQGLKQVRRPRPAQYWPVDAFYLAERLVFHGSRLQNKNENEQ
jgi:ADP-ribosyl-[dinitrogen reductase] hydrolase